MRSTAGCSATPSEVLRILCRSPPVATMPGSPVRTREWLFGFKSWFQELKAYA
jgi:hypothetical protein